MNWLNIKTSMLRASEFIGSEPVARATWLSVITYSVEQENGGRVANCKGWKDRQWQQICGVTLDEINASSPLLVWENNDLLVWSYPVQKEAEIKVKREAGQRGGKAVTQAKVEAARTNGAKHNPSSTQAEAKLKRSCNPTELEGEGEGEGERNKTVGRVSKAALPDDAWISSLKSDSAYVGIAVEAEIGKCRRWCETNRKKPSRRRIINWLNRVEKPVSFHATGKSQPNLYLPPDFDWKARISSKWPISEFPNRPNWEDGEWSDVPMDRRQEIYPLTK